MLQVVNFSLLYKDALERRKLTKRSIQTVKFYLTEDIYSRFVGMTIVFCVVSLWSQYKYIAFNIFSCRILIISYKMSIITGISNETTNESTIYAILCRNITISYRQRISFVISSPGKIERVQELKIKLLE